MNLVAQSDQLSYHARPIPNAVIHVMPMTVALVLDAVSVTAIL